MTPAEQSDSAITVKVTIETIGTAIPPPILEKKDVTIDQWEAIINGLRDGIKAANALPGPKGRR